MPYFHLKYISKKDSHLSHLFYTLLIKYFLQIFFIFRRRATSRVQACTDRSRWGWRATAASRGSNDSTRRSVILWWQLAVNSDFQSLDVLDYANVKCDDGICVEEKMLGCDFPAFIKKCIFLSWMCFPQVRFDQPTTGTGNKQKYF